MKETMSSPAATPPGAPMESHLQQRLQEETCRRLRAEDALRHSQSFFSSLVDQLPIGIFRKDSFGRYTFVNRHFCQIKNLSAGQLLGKTPPAAPGVAPQTHHNFIMETGQTVETEEQQPDRDGAMRSYQVIRGPVFGPDGEIVGSQGMLFDITERKRLEATLSHEQELFKTLMDAIPDNVYFKDVSGRIQRASKSKVEATMATVRASYRAAHPAGDAHDWPAHLASAEAFGQWLLGKTDYDTYPEAHARTAAEDENQIMSTAQPMVAKIEKCDLPDGSAIWWLAAKMPRWDTQGKIVGTVGISKDITALKEAEAALERTHRELMIASRQAGMAEVATGVLHNVGNVLNSVNISAGVVTDQLKNSKSAGLLRLVRLLEDHKDSLASFFTEDERGRTIPAYVQRLAETLDGERLKVLEELGRLNANISHITEIVAAQQNYAGIAGVIESVSLADLVEDAVKIHKTAFSRHHIKLQREYETLPPASVDKHKILQIVVNLLHNAKYACEDSGADEKRISVRVKPAAEERARIEVADNGVGIAAENLTRIFSHGFTTRKNGHGFGLHSGALAAREMGGSLLAHSAGPGKGATFVLEIPVLPPPTAPARPWLPS